MIIPLAPPESHEFEGCGFFFERFVHSMEKDKVHVHSSLSSNMIHESGGNLCAE